jgi:hypothetical protein
MLAIQDVCHQHGELLLAAGEGLAEGGVAEAEACA